MGWPVAINDQRPKKIENRMIVDKRVGNLFTKKMTIKRPSLEVPFGGAKSQTSFLYNTRVITFLKIFVTMSLHL
jgi:hypothetical protein